MSKLEPYFFVPRSKLEIPSESCTSEVLCGLIEDAGIIEAPVRAASILTRHFPHVPEWRSWDDGSGGTVHLCENDSNDEVPLQYRENEVPISPLSLDGCSFHNDEKRILTYSVRLTPKMLGVFWGVTSAPFNELLEESGDIRTTSIRTDHKGLRNFFNWQFNE